MSRTNIEIFLGIIIVLITGGLLIAYGLNEPARMAQAAEAQRAQAIEVGAQLFDTNCKGCHGVQGEGVPGLCPPLNDKNFFTNRLKEVGWSWHAGRLHRLHRLGRQAGFHPPAALPRRRQPGHARLV